MRACHERWWRRARARAESAFALVEMLMVAAIIGALTVIAGATVLSEARVRAQDVQAEVHLAYAYKLARAVWVEEGHRYPETDELVRLLHAADPIYTYRASYGGTSVSTGSRDVSVAVLGPQTVRACVLSDSGTVRCRQWQDGVVSSATGSGAYAEEDAATALPGDDTPATSDAGPGDTGTPLGGAGGAAAAPRLQLVSAPPATTQASWAQLAWRYLDSSGEVTEQTCELNGRPLPCPVGVQALEVTVPVGLHSVTVRASGPGGADAVTYAWQRVNPPSDWLVVLNAGDYASAPYPASAKPTGAFEVGGWVLLAEAPTGSDATVVSLGCTWSQGQECRAEDSGFTFAVTRDLRPTLRVRAGSSVIDEQWGAAGKRLLGPAPALTLGVWHYVSGSYDPDGRLCTWVDGQLSACSAPLAGRTPSVHSQGPLLIGAQPNSAGQVQAWLRGVVAELRLTRGGGPAHPLVVGPAAQPAQLADLAENGRPATWLYHFDSPAEGTGTLGALELHGGAYLSPAF